MARLKNITASSISLQMFNTSSPKVNYADRPVVLSLNPGEDVDESYWKVANINDPSYNVDILDEYILQGIITRIP